MKSSWKLTKIACLSIGLHQMTRKISKNNMAMRKYPFSYEPTNPSAKSVYKTCASGFHVFPQWLLFICWWRFPFCLLCSNNTSHYSSFSTHSHVHSKKKSFSIIDKSLHVHIFRKRTCSLQHFHFKFTSFISDWLWKEMLRKKNLIYD